MKRWRGPSSRPCAVCHRLRRAGVSRESRDKRVEPPGEIFQHSGLGDGADLEPPSSAASSGEAAARRREVRGGSTGGRVDGSHRQRPRSAPDRPGCARGGVERSGFAVSGRGAGASESWMRPARLHLSPPPRPSAPPPAKVPCSSGRSDGRSGEQQRLSGLLRTARSRLMLGRVSSMPPGLIIWPVRVLAETWWLRSRASSSRGLDNFCKAASEWRSSSSCSPASSGSFSWGGSSTSGPSSTQLAGPPSPARRSHFVKKCNASLSGLSARVARRAPALRVKQVRHGRCTAWPHEKLPDRQ
jgi:hypothetical protein